MGHKCDYKFKLKRTTNQKIYFETIAHYKEKHIAVQRLFENGKCKERYLWDSCISGWLVSFPGERLSYYYGSDKVQEIKWSDIKSYKRENCAKLTHISTIDWESILNEISIKRPELKYFCKKILIGCKNVSPYEFLDLLNIYQVHPEIEPLIEYGYIKIALNKNLRKYKKQTINKALNYLKNNGAKINELYYEKGINLKQLLLFSKNEEYTCEEMYIMQRYAFKIEQVRYCLRKKIEYSDYANYIKKVQEVGHTLDDYWSFPNNFQKQFDKVNNESLAIQKAQYLSKKTMLDKGLEKFKKMSLKTQKIIKNYRLYIPYQYEDFVKQAQELNQCLIRCNYVESMNKLKDVLIFIVDDKTSKRIATAEIDYKKELLQLYGYEYNDYNDLSHDKSKVTPELKEIIINYIKDLKLIKPKIHYFKNDRTVYNLDMVNV